MHAANKHLSPDHNKHSLAIASGDEAVGACVPPPCMLVHLDGQHMCIWLLCASTMTSSTLLLVADCYHLGTCLQTTYMIAYPEVA